DAVGRERRVLFLAARIGEAQVHPLHVVVFDHLQRLFGHGITAPSIGSLELVRNGFTADRASTAPNPPFPPESRLVAAEPRILASACRNSHATANPAEIAAKCPSTGHRHAPQRCSVSNIARAWCVPMSAREYARRARNRDRPWSSARRRVRARDTT